MIRTSLLAIISSQDYKYKDPKAHLDCRQQARYTHNKWMNKWNWDCVTCFIENTQNCAGCANYCVDYTGKSMMTSEVLVAITQGRMCVLDNIECETGKTGSRASTLICLIDSLIISFILSPVPVPPRAMASISRMVLIG